MEPYSRQLVPVETCVGPAHWTICPTAAQPWGAAHVPIFEADPLNSMTEAAYVGTYLAARAIAAAETNLTRAGLAHVLDSQSFADGLIDSGLAWGFAARAEPVRAGL